MKTGFCIFSLLVFSSFNLSVISKKHIPRLISYSDLIIIGQIESINDSTYTINVLETLKGKNIKKLLIHDNRSNLRTLFRWSKHEVGQTELVFLDYNKYFKCYSLTSENGDAEIPIKDSTIYLYNTWWVISKNNERYPENKVTLNDNSFNSTPYKKTEMINAIKDYNANWRKLSSKMRKEKDIQYMINGHYPYPIDISIQDKFLNAFQLKSKSHQRLINELMDEPNLIP